MIFGGQLLSLLLTLLATPVAYALFDDVRERFRPLAWVAGLRRRRPAVPAPSES